MPDRVKCLHALVAHELAVPGTNPFGREALDAAGRVVVARPVRDRRRRGEASSEAGGWPPIDCGTNSIRLLIADIDPETYGACHRYASPRR